MNKEGATSLRTDTQNTLGFSCHSKSHLVDERKQTATTASVWTNSDSEPAFEHRTE